MAALGSVSMYATLPAATLLGMRAIRRRRGGDGSEPAIGMLAFGIMWVSLLLAYPAMRVIVIAAERAGGWAPRAFLGTLVVLSATIVALARLAIRMHPERRIARRFLLAGIGLAIAAALTPAMVLVLGGLSAWSFNS